MNRSIASNLLGLVILLVVSVGGSSARSWDSDSPSSSTTASPSLSTGLRQKVAAPKYTSPSAGATVSGTLKVSGTASRSTTVVALAIDGGAYRAAAGTTKWSQSIDTTTLSNGGHVLVAKASTSSGGSATASVSVTVNNPAPDSTPPTVVIARPLSGAAVAGVVAVAGTAADTGGVSKIEVEVDAGAFTDAQGTTSWTYSFDAAALPAGSHTLTVRATDAAGNTGSAQVAVTTAPPPLPPPPPPGPTTPSWLAGTEAGTLGEWDNGGGEFNSGGGDSVPSQDFAHTGSWAVKQTIDTSGGNSSGTRMTRWAEFRTLRAGQGVRITAWVYVPRPVQISGFFNLFQNKSHTQNDSYVDVFWQVSLRSRSDGSLYLNAKWGCGAENPNFPHGPFSTSTSLCDFWPPLQNVDFPVGRWVKLTEEIVPSSAYTGTFKFWQDDTLLYDYEGTVLTGYPNTRDANGVDNEFSVNAYSNGTTPTTYTQYVDDASITPLGP